DSQRVARQAPEPFDVILRAHRRIECPLDFADARRLENKNVAAFWPPEIVTQLVHENLIARVDVPARNDLARLETAADADVERRAQSFRRRIDDIRAVLATQLGEREESRALDRANVVNRVVGFRDDVDVIASEDRVIENLF